MMVRLSSWVYFVNYNGGITCIHHVLTGEEWLLSLEDSRRLMSFVRFQPATDRDERWIRGKVLVEPGEDPLVPAQHNTPEAALNTQWTNWYWRTEPDAEREYRWLGEPVVKMPSDLFFYQELMHSIGAKSVLEIGYGHGGSLWFFGHILQATGGGYVVGVDNNPAEKLPPFHRLESVRFLLDDGDAMDEETRKAVSRTRPCPFDLVVIDTGQPVLEKLELLRAWSPLVSPKGVIVLEDVTAPEFVELEEQVSLELDRFLLDHPKFGIIPGARRFAVGKTMRAAYRRIE